MENGNVIQKPTKKIEDFQTSTNLSSPTDVYSHLNYLYGPKFNGYLEVWDMDTKTTRSFKFAELEIASEYIQALSKNTCVFFSYGLQPNKTDSKSRGSAKNVSAIPCFWFDLDYINSENPSAHKDNALPNSKEEALDFAKSLPIEPTIIIHSGNGFYLIWKFHSLEIIRSDRDRNRLKKLSKSVHSFVKDKGAENGWNLDNTSDLGRLTRPIGSINRKSTPIKVSVEEFNGKTYEPNDFNFMSIKNINLESSAPPTVNRSTVSDTENNSDPSQIVQKCKWMNHCIDDAVILPETEWKMACSIISRCANGRAFFHEMSKDYPNYNSTETDQKINQSRQSGGPILCKSVEHDFGGKEYCNSCEFKGRIKSPIVLGMPIFNIFQDWCFVVEEDTYYNLKNGQLLRRNLFGEAMRSKLNKRQSASIEFNSSKATTIVDRTTFEPNETIFFDSNGLKYLNVWRNSGIESEEGDPTIFLNHLEYLFPMEAERKMLLDVMAFIVQNPGKRLGYMTLIHGEPGTGKSYLGNVLSKILGPTNVNIVGTEHIKSQWSDWMVHVALVIIEELMASGRLEVTNSLKAKITEETIRVDKKHCPSFEVKNSAKFIAFTNHSVATYVSSNDRRVLVLNSPSQPNTEEYYVNLWNWTERNLGVICKFLCEYDLSKFNPNGHAPTTSAKLDLIEDSRPPLEAEIACMIEEERTPFNREIVRIEDIRSALRFTEFENSSARKIAFALRELGAKKLEQFKLSDNSKPRLWVIKNASNWALLSNGKWSAKNTKAIEVECFKGSHLWQK